MAVEVHVEGQVADGKLPDFAEAVQHYQEYAGSHGYAVPQVLLGLSGKMNTVRLVYRYDDLSHYEQQEVDTLHDREYGKVAAAMCFASGSLSYTIYHQL